jgi:transposase InsO family protein
MEALAIRPLASVRTISRILLRQQLTRRRVGPYQPKGKRYPAPIARHPGAVHQSDFVGPCYLQGALRFYSLNSVDLSTARCAVQPLVSRAAQGTIDAFWSSWSRLGLPQHQQVDNELVFYGSPAHPRGMGSLIRLCLTQDIEVWFIPPGEPWRNGVVEKFNDHWRQKLLGRIRMKALEDVQRESIAFEQRHNSRYRYSKLGGKTPTGALAASAGKLRFPASFSPPRHPLPKPQSGRYHLIRFIRSDGLLDVFGEKFKAPPETVYEYIQATVEVQRQRLQVRLDGVLIDEHKYGLR